MPTVSGSVAVRVTRLVVMKTDSLTWTEYDAGVHTGWLSSASCTLMTTSAVPNSVSGVPRSVATTVNVYCWTVSKFKLAFAVVYINPFWSILNFEFCWLGTAGLFASYKME